MAAETTEAEFAAMVRHAGLPLTAAQQASLREVWSPFQAICARNRAPLPGAPAPAQPRVITQEPATTFRPDGAR